jgi:hypothetical protein
MALRPLFALLVVAATAAFVVGVAIERSTGEGHAAEPAGEAAKPAGEAEEASHGAEPAGEADEASRGEQAESHEKLAGIDIEAAPFVALATAASLLIAAAVWLRPRLATVLAVAAVAMLAFAAFDVRELFHQIDEQRAGLAVLAAAIAVLHLAASATALVLRRPVA